MNPFVFEIAGTVIDGGGLAVAFGVGDCVDVGVERGAGDDPAAGLGLWPGAVVGLGLAPGVVDGDSPGVGEVAAPDSRTWRIADTWQVVAQHSSTRWSPASLSKGIRISPLTLPVRSARNGNLTS